MNSWEEKVQEPKIATKTLMVETNFCGAGCLSHEATIDDVAAWYNAQTEEDQKAIRNALAVSSDAEVHTPLHEALVRLLHLTGGDDADLYGHVEEIVAEIAAVVELREQWEKSRDEVNQLRIQVSEWKVRAEKAERDMVECYGAILERDALKVRVERAEEQLREARSESKELKRIRERAEKAETELKISERRVRAAEDELSEIRNGEFNWGAYEGWSSTASERESAERLSLFNLREHQKMLDFQRSRAQQVVLEEQLKQATEEQRIQLTYALEKTTQRAAHHKAMLLSVFDIDPITKERAERAEFKLQKALDEIEQLRGQLAGCGVAALGQRS